MACVSDLLIDHLLLPMQKSKKHEIEPSAMIREAFWVTLGVLSTVKLGRVRLRVGIPVRNKSESALRRRRRT